MAFDMYFRVGAVKRREKVDLHEEFILQLMDEDDKYPTANFLWESFYNGPQLNPDQSNQLVHELLLLKSESTNHHQFKLITTVVDRLVIFFSTAYRNNVSITCISD